MKKIALFISAFLLAAISSKAQSFCDADFSIDIPGITFTTFNFWGDSSLNISVTNNSGLNYAYPQAKIFNTTPLPPGMTQNSHYQMWYPFASSYNNLQTSTIPFGYDVTQAIPSNYMVSFTLWLRPNDTAVGYDSCRFQQNFTVNLNPQTGIEKLGISAAFIVAFPNPAHSTVTFLSNGNQGKFVSAKILNLQGQEVQTKNMIGNELNISELTEGIYFVLLYDDKGELVGKTKLVKQQF